MAPSAKITGNKEYGRGIFNYKKSWWGEGLRSWRSGILLGAKG